MTTIKHLERLKKIHQLIKIGSTGNPKEFSKRLFISESQLYNILEDLKIKGFPICYSRSLRSYMYDDDCELEINYSVQLLTTHDKIFIIGGCIKNYFTPMQLEWRKVV